jgi:hypothetical protein
MGGSWFRGVVVKLVGKAGEVLGESIPLFGRALLQRSVDQRRTSLSAASAARDLAA